MVHFANSHELRSTLEEFNLSEAVNMMIADDDDDDDDDDVGHDDGDDDVGHDGI